MGILIKPSSGSLRRTSGSGLDEAQLAELHRKIDIDQSGTISLEEFSQAIPKFIRARAECCASELGDDHALAMERGMERVRGTAEDSDEEEVPEDLKHEDPYKERRRILMRASAR